MTNRFLPPALLALLTIATSRAAAELDSAQTEYRFGVGHTQYDATWRDSQNEIDTLPTSDTGMHLNLGFARHIGRSGRHLFGVGIDYDRIFDARMLGFRALDYRYEVTEKLDIGAFFGAATLDTGLPQNGFYLGLSLSYHVLQTERGSLAVDCSLRNGNGLARDTKLADDPTIVSPDFFLDFYAPTLALSWNF